MKRIFSKKPTVLDLQTRVSILSAFLPALQKGYLLLNPFSMFFPGFKKMSLVWREMWILDLVFKDISAVGSINDQGWC